MLRHYLGGRIVAQTYRNLQLGRGECIWVEPLAPRVLGLEACTIWIADLLSCEYAIEDLENWRANAPWATKAKTKLTLAIRTSIEVHHIPEFACKLAQGVVSRWFSTERATYILRGIEFLSTTVLGKR